MVTSREEKGIINGKMRIINFISNSLALIVEPV
jgi:hypothetical protein